MPSLCLNNTNLRQYLELQSVYPTEQFPQPKMSSATEYFAQETLKTEENNGNVVERDEENECEEEEEDEEFEGLTAERIKIALAAMSAPAPQGILSHGGEHKSKQHVTINAPEQPEKRQREQSPAPDPSKVTAPVVNFAIKDEVELLRAGVMNTHGHHVKPQGQ
ncbi:hypothetical protein QR680_016524 [Steinernema hermaphroditum]|uniref:Uncharacterized protein n=1 Tax=Steinernema hermaphroditum TaxID=289476 RepID=A0AA39HDZ0_9BILA|nr:hypothetical protein QR680_016524 [Steinernema hermaphroditum]